VSAEDANEVPAWEHPLVTQIVGARPGDPPTLVMLVGFNGRSHLPGHRRLYRDPELRSWFDIPEDAIVHEERLPVEYSALRENVLWVARSTELVPLRGEPEERAGQRIGIMAENLLELRLMPPALRLRVDPILPPGPTANGGPHGTGPKFP
jgi:hypothetical protein